MPSDEDTIAYRFMNTSGNHAVAGLYAVTPDLEDTAALLARTTPIVANGARLLQYRNKTAGPALRREQAGALARLCREHGVLFIVNDHLDVAVDVDADGVHIGAEDGPVAAARERLGAGKLLGVTCYRRIENALEAERLGADYVAFGGFFPSTVKPGLGAGRTPLSLLGEARQRQKLPVIAIGGITPDNAPALIAAGADGVAVITALYGAADPAAAARHFAGLFR